MKGQKTPCCGYGQHVRDRDPTGSLELPHEESYMGGGNRARSVLQVLYSRTMPLFTVIYTELQACSDPLIHYNVPTFLFALHTS